MFDKQKNQMDAAAGCFEDLTPKEIVSRLDEYIVGQDEAKRAVAIAIRNRLRRLRVEGDLRDEIIPKNLILIGPTGVGKTEIARRMAKLLKAPFIKVEASKFTEVGYVGRDVESIIRDLTESAVRMVRQERLEGLRGTLMGRVVDRLTEYLQPLPSRPRRRAAKAADNADPEVEEKRMHEQEERFEQVKRIREKMRKRLRTDELDDSKVTIDAAEGSPKLMQVFTSQGMEEMGMDLQNIFDSMSGEKPMKKRQVTVGEAKRILMADEADRAVDMDSVVREAVERVELAGIVFVDEIDKIAHREGKDSHGPDVSREGVQRDILPLVEGTTVITKYGPVRTHHILFCAAGAFHVTKVSDLIPEFQGRFPLRVELSSLSEADFIRILREPKNSLVKQYTALLATEGVTIEFTEDAVNAMAHHAAEANSLAQNIGARRLHTVMEKVLEDISFDAPYEEKSGVRSLESGVGAAYMPPADESTEAQTSILAEKPTVPQASPPASSQGRERTIIIDAEYVNGIVADLIKDKDVAGYIL